MAIEKLVFLVFRPRMQGYWRVILLGGRFLNDCNCSISDPKKLSSLPRSSSDRRPIRSPELSHRVASLNDVRARSSRLVPNRDRPLRCCQSLVIGQSSSPRSPTLGICKNQEKVRKIERHYPCPPQPPLTSMKAKQLLRLIAISVAALQIPLLSAQKTVAQSADALSSFQCRVADDYHVTLAVKHNGSLSDPLIVWTTDEFSNAGYTPERRCSEVTERLNSLLQENGGTLSGLYMTAGIVNGHPVLCAVNNTRSGCNTTNVLFTLKRENRSNPGRVLETLLNYNATGSGSPIQESGGQPYVNLERLVQQLF
jgi:hypothetical protein